MKPPFSGLPFLAAFAALGTIGAPRAQDAEPRVPLQDEIPALARLSSWAQDTTFRGDDFDAGSRGVYPVGNGQVFAHLGLGARANTMRALTGPGYQTDDAFAPRGHYGALTCDVLLGREPAPMPEQRVRRVSGAAFVVTEDAGPAVALRTLTFAPPEATHLVRVLEVENKGDTPLRDVSLRALLDGETRQDGQNVIRERYVSERRPSLAYYAMTEGLAEGSALVADIGVLEPGERWRGVLTISTVAGLDPPAEWHPLAADVEPALAAARATLAWWQERLAGTATVDTDHHKLRDLFLDWKVLMLVQRDAGTGMVVPMINHRAARIREQVGPMLFFLRSGLWDDARAILEFVFESAQRLGAVVPEVPLDGGAPPADGPVDWSAVEVPASEIPSWVVLQHFWYWRTTGDTELIRRHWPLLEVCIKRQKRGADSLMTFHGEEPYLHGALYSTYPERVGAGSGFIAHHVSRGRDTWSLPSSVLFLLATQAIGEMLDGIDRADHRERWQDGEPESRPGRRWVERGFQIMRDVEKRYWLEDRQRFAPALSPVTLEPHPLPFANCNLVPLWAGWTFPTGEKSRDNLRNTLQHLWQRDGRIGTTPTVGYATGELQGMLLVALSERDAARRLDALEALLEMAEPAGEWGELYGPDGRPTWSRHPGAANRCQPLASGINLDAIMFAINGVRYATIANWDDDDIRLELRMPRGASYVTMKDVAKDGRRLHVFVREVVEPMTEDERRHNAGLPPERRRDPGVSHRAMRFRVELLSQDPPSGYWDVGLNALGTMHPRRISRTFPIDEKVLWAEDHLEFLPPDGGRRELDPIRVEKTPEATLLALTARAAGAEIVGEDSVTVVDTGLPLSVASLAELLVADGRRRHDVLCLDWGWDHPGRATFKPESVWADVWAPAVAAFEDAGGVVHEPAWLERWAVRGEAGWLPVVADGGRLSLPGGGDDELGVRARFDSDAAREAVLRVGSGCGVEVLLNGEAIYAREGARLPLPDADTHLVRLREGENELVVHLRPDGEPVLFARITDTRGLPVPGIVER